MRRIVRGLAMVGLVAGVGFAVYTLTRLAREGSADQFDTPPPANPRPAPSKKERDEPKPSDKPPAPRPSPDNNQWPVIEPK